MKRMHLLAVAMGLTIAAACTDMQGPARSPVTEPPARGATVVDPRLTFKVQVGSTWYSLVIEDDFIAGNPSDSTWTIRANGTTHSHVAISAIAIDTTNYGQGTKQNYGRTPMAGYGTKQGDFRINGAFLAALTDYRPDTSVPDSLVLSTIFADDSTGWHIRFAGGSYDYTQGQLIADNTGSFRFYMCTSAPTCTFVL